MEFQRQRRPGNSSMTDIRPAAVAALAPRRTSTRTQPARRRSASPTSSARTRSTARAIIASLFVFVVTWDPARIAVVGGSLILRRGFDRDRSIRVRCPRTSPRPRSRAAFGRIKNARRVQLDEARGCHHARQRRHVGAHGRQVRKGSERRENHPVASWSRTGGG